ncbi:MAG: proprotein convertase P-domain-containing protein [Bryobacteraceae bacterium]
MRHFRRICSTLFIFVAAASAAIAQTQTGTYSYTGSPLTIYPSSANFSTVAQIAVPTGLAVSNVTAQVNIQYPNVSDLIVYLYSAQNTRTILLQNNCGSLANVNTTFDDAAQTSYSTFCPQEAGRGPFRANEPLANSKGEFAAGYWTLVVQNTKSNSNTGLLLGFTVNITGTLVTQPSFALSSVANTASLVADGFVAPGEIVSIFGVALGPQPGVQAGSGTLPVSLGGTTVTFDGIPAPILYSSYFQLNILTPFTLTPGATTQVRVQTAGGTTSPATLDVLSSAAGLFTMQSNGAGQVSAVNQDGTVNSTANPAPAGSTVALYASGLGAVTPAITTGAPAPANPLSKLNSVVAAVINGVSAPVSFAGLAPGLAGVYQVNVMIPAGMPSGRRRVFLVSPNGFSSQTGAYIQVQ